MRISDWSSDVCSSDLLSDGGEAFRAALTKLEFETPTGMVKLDERRNAIADIFLTEVIEGPDGNLVNKTLKVIPQVDQTLGMSYDEFLKYGPVSRERSEEHTSAIQSLMRIPYAVFCITNKKSTPKESQT